MGAAFERAVHRLAQRGFKRVGVREPGEVTVASGASEDRKPLLRATATGGRTFGGPNQILISAGVPTSVEDATMRATFAIGDGDQVGFALQWAAPEDPAPEPTAA